MFADIRAQTKPMEQNPVTNGQNRYPESEDLTPELNDVEAFDHLSLDPIIEAYQKHVDRTFSERI